MLKSGAGALLTFAGGLLLILGLALSMLSARMHAELGDARPYVWGVAALLLIGGPLLAKFGRQLRAQSGETVLAGDARIVTYLRSFVDDADADRVRTQLSAQQLVMGSAIGASLATEEEQIALALAEAGPLVAIGRPGERLPQLGAARVYVDDDSWQDKVIEMIDRSNLVLMRAGETDGFWWEIARVREHMQPARVIILLPRKADHYERFRNRIAPHLPYALPNFEPGDGTGSFGGLLWFDSDWTPHVERSKAPFNISRHPIAADVRRMAEAALAAIGFVRAPLATLPRRAAAIGIDIAIITLPFAALGMLYAAMNAPVWAWYAVIAIVLGVLLAELTPLRASPGKWLMGLRIADAQGFVPRFTQLAIRVILRPTASIFWFVTLPLILLGKPALHDLISGTSVFAVNRPRIARQPPPANLQPA